MAKLMGPRDKLGQVARAFWRAIWDRPLLWRLLNLLALPLLAYALWARIGSLTQRWDLVWGPSETELALTLQGLFFLDLLGMVILVALALSLVTSRALGWAYLVALALAMGVGDGWRQLGQPGLGLTTLDFSFRSDGWRAFAMPAAEILISFGLAWYFWRRRRHFAPAPAGRDHLSLVILFTLLLVQNPLGKLVVGWRTEARDRLRAEVTWAWRGDKGQDPLLLAWVSRGSNDLVNFAWSADGREILAVRQVRPDGAAADRFSAQIHPADLDGPAVTFDALPGLDLRDAESGIHFDPRGAGFCMAGSSDAGDPHANIGCLDAPGVALRPMTRFPPGDHGRLESISPDGALLLTGTDAEDQLAVRVRETGDVVHWLGEAGAPGSMAGGQFLPDGRILYRQTEPGKNQAMLAILSLADAAPPVRISETGRSIFAYAAGQSHLAIVSVDPGRGIFTDAEISIAAPGDPAGRRHLATDAVAVRDLAFLDRDRLLAYLTFGQTVRIVNVADGRLLQVLPTAAMRLRASPDGQSLIVAGPDHVTLWRVNPDAARSENPG